MRDKTAMKKNLKPRSTYRQTQVILTLAVKRALAKPISK